MTGQGAGLGEKAAVAVESRRVDPALDGTSVLADVAAAPEPAPGGGAGDLAKALLEVALAQALQGERPHPGRVGDHAPARQIQESWIGRRMAPRPRLAADRAEAR